jgi:t-SNARE complex subunit (syntaxin)
MREPSLAELERRMTAIAGEVKELRELVDGHEEWSHRSRLHAIRQELDAADLLGQAQHLFASASASRWQRWREWGLFLIAIAAVVLSHH